jgi:hypothetical protein
MVLGDDFMNEEEKSDNWWRDDLIIEEANSNNWWHENPEKLFKLMDALWEIGFNVKLKTTEYDIVMTIALRESNTSNITKAEGRREEDLRNEDRYQGRRRE